MEYYGQNCACLEHLTKNFCLKLLNYNEICQILQPVGHLAADQYVQLEMSSISPKQLLQFSRLAHVKIRYEFNSRGSRIQET